MGFFDGGFVETTATTRVDEDSRAVVVEIEYSPTGTEEDTGELKVWTSLGGEALVLKLAGRGR